MLRDIQDHFRDAVMGDADGALAAHVVAPRGPVAARIDVYRNTVQASLIDVIAVAFPVVQRIVGPAFFAGLARDFVRSAPPQRPQLSIYGAALPAFIARCDVAQRLPYLADVARLEWARSEAYFAPDAPPLSPARLATVAEDAIAGLRLILHPAARLICSAHPIATIWRENQPAVIDVPTVELNQAEAALVTRPAMHVVTRGISPGDAALVGAFAEGTYLEDAMLAALAVEPAFNLQTALQGHLMDGTFEELS